MACDSCAVASWPSSRSTRSFWAAPAARAAGDVPSALALTEEAEELLPSFDDAGTLTTLLHDVQRRLSLARRRRHERDSAALTEAELAVLRALRSPKSERAIAQELSISINTVKTHTSAIYRKLAVGSRDDAITRATEGASSGWGDAPSCVSPRTFAET